MQSKWILFLLVISMVSCKQESPKKPLPKKPTKVLHDKNNDEKPIPEIRYTEKELLAFMDSIAKLPLKPLEDKVAFQSDSIFRSQKDYDKNLSKSEFTRLKNAIKNEQIEIDFAKTIFGNFVPGQYHSIEKGKTPIMLYSFDKNKNDFNEFAICLDYPVESDHFYLYFFKSSRLLCRIKIYFRYEFELEHYKDTNNKTVIYYKENYMTGSGVWWYNYYFYLYDDQRLIPILNEVQESNLQSMGLRTLNLKTEIVKTKPLTIKMVYYQQLFDTIDFYKTPKIIDDSTFVTYNWNQKTKMLVGDYAHSKLLNKASVLSYYLERDSELLFIRSSYEILKKGLKNPAKKRAILTYLNTVKNYLKDE